MEEKITELQNRTYILSKRLSYALFGVGLLGILQSIQGWALLTIIALK